MSEIRMDDNNGMTNLLKGFLNKALTEIMDVVSAECASLFLFDPQNKELVLDSFYNSDNLNLCGLRQRVGEGISGKVVDTRVPVLVKDIDKDLRFQGNGFQHYRTNSFISIPLFNSQGLLGLINLTDKSSGEPFSENDLKFAVFMSKYACLLVDSLINTSELKQERKKLNKQKSQLEKYASVGKLAAGIVHEINNPLDGIIRYANILLNQIEGDSIIREYLLEIKRGLNRIGNITKSLLDFSRQVNSNSMQIKKYADLHKLIDESLDVLKDNIYRRITVNKKYRENLPKILDLGLSHVFINIIKNALDAMPGVGVLEISTGIKDSVLEISFKDTGLGMPTKIMEHIFEPFYTTKGIDKGTGLGLSICKEIINRYGGRIEVESLSGKGSNFTILIHKKYLENG